MGVSNVIHILHRASLGDLVDWSRRAADCLAGESECYSDWVSGLFECTWEYEDGAPNFGPKARLLARRLHAALDGLEELACEAHFEITLANLELGDSAQKALPKARQLVELLTAKAVAILNA